MFETVYGAGLRISEMIHLRVQDIDSKQMRIFVHHGKGGKDRFTLLSQRNLDILREYWKQYQPNHPEGYLFYARSKDKHILTSHSVQNAFNKYKTMANLPEVYRVHTLRHCFATHLLESGVEVCQIKELLAQYKAMDAIQNCGTSRLGGHLNKCPNCGYEKPSYNSCRNRHCPKCQTFSKERWIDAQKADLLDVGYFHVVFTVPQELNPLIYHNQKECYNLLFRCAAETLQELARDKKYLGASIGHTAVLHTWGQNLCFHPHIHSIVPSGGLTPLGKWRSSRKKFFLPVRVLSRKFRGKFLSSNR